MEIFRQGAEYMIKVKVTDVEKFRTWAFEQGIFPFDEAKAQGYESLNIYFPPFPISDQNIIEKIREFLIKVERGET